MESSQILFFEWPEFVHFELVERLSKGILDRHRDGQQIPDDDFGGRIEVPGQQEIPFACFIECGTMGKAVRPEGTHLQDLVFGLDRPKEGE